jgi:hypothetical protein
MRAGAVVVWNRSLPWVFLALVGPLCLFLALAVPPGEVPDEPAHAARADSLRHGEVLGHRHGDIAVGGATVAAAGVTADRTLVATTFSLTPGPLAGKHMTRARWEALGRLPWDARPGFVYAPNTAVYVPVFYLPAALGLELGRLAGGGPLRALLRARLVNAVTFLGLGALALGLARAGRGLLFLTLSLPMTVWLAGSVSPDGLLIATAALAAAALTRTGDGARWPVGLAAAGIALMGAAKPCYLPMALALLAAPDRLGRPWLDRRRLLFVVAVALPGLAWAAVAALLVAVPFTRAPYLPGPLWPGDPARVFASTDVGAQLLVLARGPWRLLTLPVASLWGGLRVQAMMTAGVLGTLDLVLPSLWYQAAGLAALAAAGADWLRGAECGRGVGWAGAAAIALGVAGSVQAIYLLQYLSWTPVGATLIEGVQGRYFLPLLPFVGVALAASRRAPWPRAAALAGVLPVLLAAFDTVFVARQVLVTYYLG